MLCVISFRFLRTPECRQSFSGGQGKESEVLIHELKQELHKKDRIRPFVFLIFLIRLILLIARVPANFLRHPLKRAFKHFTMTSRVQLNEVSPVFVLRHP